MVSTRTAEADDLPFLWDMLWEAAAVAPSMRALGKENALALPENHRYLADWGRAGDLGVVAVDDAGRRVGAAWIRIFRADSPAYGFVSADVPELAIGVAQDARRRGVGGALLDALFDRARTQGFLAISLAVDRRNPAKDLYARKGFRDAGVSDPADDGLTMIIAL